jgi:hypothetical protein
MSDLQKRLDNLFRSGLLRKGIDPRKGRAIAPGPRPAYRRNGAPRTPDSAFEAVETGDGGTTCLRFEHRLPAEAVHGLGVPVGRLLSEVDLPAGPGLVRGEPLAPREALLFLDTETTGLAMGTGTCAFLVGIGFFEGDDFRVVQFFMRDFPEEPALLDALEEAAAPFRQIVTFNGSAFDLELLRTRYLLAGRLPPFEDRPGLDLLHLGRRFYRERLENCRLATIEREVLGFRREGDVEGALIPSLYFQYLRSGAFPDFDRILTHNVHDIVSMVCLAHLFDRALRDPFGSAELHGGAFLQIGALLEETGAGPDGLVERCYREAMRHGLDRREGYEAARRLSLRMRRERDYSRASEIWQAMIDRRDPADIFPLVEMAKHCEHRRGEYGRAIELVTEAMKSLERAGTEPAYGPPSRRKEELLHRLARLERRDGRRRSG